MRAICLVVRADVLTVLILKSLAVDGFINRVTVNLSRTHLKLYKNIKISQRRVNNLLTDMTTKKQNNTSADNENYKKTETMETQQLVRYSN